MVNKSNLRNFSANAQNLIIKKYATDPSKIYDWYYLGYRFTGTWYGYKPIEGTFKFDGNKTEAKKYLLDKILKLRSVDLKYLKLLEPGYTDNDIKDAKSEVESKFNKFAEDYPERALGYKRDKNFSYVPKYKVVTEITDIDFLKDIIRQNPDDKNLKKIYECCRKYNLDSFVDTESLRSDIQDDAYDQFNDLVNYLIDNSEVIEEIYSIDEKHYYDVAKVYQADYKGTDKFTFIINRVHDMGGLDAVFFNIKDSKKFEFKKV